MVMKFDCILANPPYQSKAEEEFKKTTAIWPQFVEKSLSVLKDGGHMGMIHPSGWRNVDGMFKDTQKLILDNTVEYLEMNDSEKGMRTFSASTTYDVYCLKKELNALKKTTTIKLDDGSIVQKYINDVEFIPNGMFDEFDKLVAKEGEEKVEVLHSYSAYETRKEWISKEQTDEFKYPVISIVRKTGEIELQWSSTDQNGHYGVPKVVWSNTHILSTGTYIDEFGKYALNQFQYGILDKVENLEKIAEVIKSEKFLNLMQYAITGVVPRLNYKVISTFRKDFWKEFI